MKKAERQKIGAFELWCWRKLLRVPWTARRFNQCILRKISPGCSLEGLMLKLQYFGHLIEEPTHWKRAWFWGRLRAGREGSDRGWDGWMASSTQWTWVWANSRRWWRTGNPGMQQSMGLPSQTCLSDWTTTENRKSNIILIYFTDNDFKLETRIYISMLHSTLWRRYDLRGAWRTDKVTD